MVAKKIVPLHLIGKLKESSAANFKLAANPDSFAFRFYGDSALKEFTIEELLSTLTVDDSTYSPESKMAYANLTAYIWENYSDQLITAFEVPSSFERCWKALVKVADQGISANHIFSQVSKSKLFGLPAFRNILKAELTGTPQSQQSTHLVSTAFMMDGKFVKNTLCWSYALGLQEQSLDTKTFNLKQLNNLNASSKILDDILSGAISEEGVQNYLKWAQSPYRVLDRITFAIWGAARFDRTHSPYPPSKNFVQQVATALKAKKQNQKQQTQAFPISSLDLDKNAAVDTQLTQTDSLSIQSTLSSSKAGLDKYIEDKQSLISINGLINEIEKKLEIVNYPSQSTQSNRMVINKAVKKYLNWMTHPLRMLENSIPVSFSKLTGNVSSLVQSLSNRFKPETKSQVKLIEYKKETAVSTETQKTLSPMSSALTPVKKKTHSPSTPLNLGRLDELESSGTPLNLGNLSDAGSASTPFNLGGLSDVESPNTPLNLGKLSDVESPSTPLNLGELSDSEFINESSLLADQDKFSEVVDSLYSGRFITNNVETSSARVCVRHNPSTKKIHFINPTTSELLYSGNFDVNSKAITLLNYSDQTFYTGIFKIDGTTIILNLEPVYGQSARVEDYVETLSPAVSPILASSGSLDDANEILPKMDKYRKASMKQSQHSGRKNPYAEKNAKYNHSASSPKLNSTKSKSRRRFNFEDNKENEPGIENVNGSHSLVESNKSNTKNAAFSVKDNYYLQSSPVSSSKHNSIEQDAGLNQAEQYAYSLK